MRHVGGQYGSILRSILSKTGTKLSKTGTNLSKTGTKLSKTGTKLSENGTKTQSNGRVNHTSGYKPAWDPKTRRYSTPLGSPTGSQKRPYVHAR